MTDHPHTESALALSILEGRATDPAITSVLVKQFAPGVHQFTLSLLNGSPDAPETARAITCLTFAIALNDPESFAGKENIRMWLYAGVLRQTRTLPALQQAHPGSTRAGKDLSGMNSLSSQAFLPLLLRYGHRLSLFDIAQLLRTSEAKIHKRLTKARQKLIEEISDSSRQQIKSQNDSFQLPISEASPPVSHYPRETQRLLDGILTPDTEADFRDHLDTCPDCTAHLKQFNKLELHLTSLLSYEPTLPEEQLQEIVEGVVQYEPTPSQPTWPPALFVRLPMREMGWVLAAAIVFLALARWLNPFFSSPPPPITPTPRAAPTLPPPQDLTTVFRQNTLLSSNPFPGQHVAWTLSNVQTGEYIPSTPVLFSPSTTYAAFGDGSQTVLWQLGDAQAQIVYEGQATITALEFFPSEEMLAIGDEAGNIWIRDLVNDRLRFHLGEIPGPVRGIAISPDQRYLAAALNEGVWVWEIKARTVQLIQKYRWEWVRLVTFSPDGKYLAVADRENTIVLWSFPEGQFLLRYEILKNKVDHRLDIVTRLAYSPDGRKLATGTFDGIVEIVALSPTPDGVQGTRLFSLPHPAWISEVRWSPDGSLLATISDTGPYGDADSASRAVYLWDTENGVLTYPPLTARITRGLSRAIFNPNGTHLLVSNFNGAVFTWELEDISHLVAAFPEPSLFTRAEQNVWEGPLPEDTLPIQFTEPDLAALPFTPFMLSPLPAQYSFVKGYYSVEEAVIVLEYQTLAGNTLTITQRLLSEAEPSPVGRWVGASSVIQPIQIHSTIGEYVTGRWTLLSSDNANDPVEESVYHWQSAGQARLRWVQGNILIELNTALFQFNRRNLAMNDLVHLAVNLIAQTETPLLFSYTVQEGDTCFDIAFRYSTTVDRIVETNQLADCDLIFIGQTLQVPLPVARETIADVDLNCDGNLERIRVILDPGLGISANFGVVVEAIPPGGSQLWPIWRWTIADTAANFFGIPEIFAGNGCEVFLGVSAFGGTQEVSGLDLFRWNGIEMVHVLDANGYFLETTSGRDGEAFRITTQSLIRDPATGMCTRTLTTYEWDGEKFLQTEENRETGVNCLTGR